MNGAFSPPGFVIVTGAGRGIGRETARQLAEAGAGVLAVDLLGEVLQAPSLAAAPCWTGLRGDITTEETQHGLLAAAAQSQAQTLGLVNCAFTESRGNILGGEADGWRHTMDVNFHAAVHLSRGLARTAIESGRGAAIVNVTSVHAGLAHPDFAAYSASKAALTAFTRSAAAEWGRHGIRVNAAAPGFVAVERNRHVWSDPELAGPLEACNDFGRLAVAADIAAPIIFLLSPAAGYITGTVLPVDGGQTSRLLEVPRS